MHPAITVRSKESWSSGESESGSWLLGEWLLGEWLLGDWLSGDWLSGDLLDKSPSFLSKSIVRRWRNRSETTTTRHEQEPNHPPSTP